MIILSPFLKKASIYICTGYASYKAELEIEVHDSSQQEDSQTVGAYQVIQIYPVMDPYQMIGTIQYSYGNMGTLNGVDFVNIDIKSKKGKRRALALLWN